MGRASIRVGECERQTQYIDIFDSAYARSRSRSLSSLSSSLRSFSQDFISALRVCEYEAGSELRGDMNMVNVGEFLGPKKAPFWTLSLSRSREDRRSLCIHLRLTQVENGCWIDGWFYDKVRNQEDLLFLRGCFSPLPKLNQ